MRSIPSNARATAGTLPRAAPRRPLPGRSTGAPLRVDLGGPRLPLALLIITTLSRVHQYFGFLSQLRPGLVLFAWAMVMILMSDRNAKLAPDNLKELPARLVLALGSAAILSAPFGISLGHSARYLIDSYWKVILLSLMVAAAARSADQLWTLIWAYVIGIGVLAWMALTVYEMQSGANGISRLGDGYSYDANDIALVCVTGIPLCLVAFRTSRTKGKVASLVILALACVAIARTGSRGGFLALLVVAGWFLVTSRSIGGSKRILIAVVGAAALAIAAPAGYLKQMGTIVEPTQDYNWTSRTGRKEVAKRGFGYLQRNPVTGIGLANFSMAEGLLSDAAAEAAVGGSGVKWSAAHNSFLQAVVELGVIGGSLFVALIGVGIVAIRRLGGRVARVMATSPPADVLLLSSVSEYLPLAFIGFAVGAFFLSFAYTDPLYLLSAFAAASLALERRLRRAQAPLPPGQFGPARAGRSVAGGRGDRVRR